MKYKILNKLFEQPVSHNPEIKKKVMLEPNELPNVTNFSQAIFTPGQIAKAHAHTSMYELFYIESGEGIIIINGEKYPLIQGTCVVVEPTEVHEIINSGVRDLVIAVLGVVAN